MPEEKKKLYINMAFGYLGVFLLFIAELRYIVIIEDIVGRSLMLFSIMCFGIFFQYIEAQLLTSRKEKLVFKSLSIVGVIIIIAIGLFLIQHK